MALKVDNSDMIINISEDEHGELYVPDSISKEIDEDKEVQVEKGVKGKLPDSPKETGLEKGTKGTILIDDKLLDEEDEIDDYGFERDADEKDDVKQTKPTKSSTGNKKGSFDGDALSAFAHEVKNKGYLPDISDEELDELKNGGDLAELLGKQLQMVVGSHREEMLQDMVNNLVKEGVIKKSDLVDELQDDTLTVDKFDGDETRMKSYLKSYYKRKGLSDKMINKQLDSIVDFEDVLTEALEDDNNFRVERKKQVAENYKKELETKKQRELSFQQELDKNTLERDEFIPGKKVTNPTKRKVLDNIPNVIQRINAEGTKILPLLSYLESLGVFDGKWDSILQVGESKATDRLSEVLKSPRKARQSEEVDDGLQYLRQVAFASLPKQR